MPFFGSFCSLVFELFDEVLFSPSDLAGQIAQLAELSEAAQFDGSKSIWNDLSLLSVIRSWDSFEDFNSTEGSGTNGFLVGKQYSSDGSPNHS